MGLALALIDRRGNVDLSSVAMPYPYLWRAELGQLQSIELGGLPLGRRHGKRPPSTTLRLEPLDLLILVSDGLIERQDPAGEPWGFDALEATLADLCRAAVLPGSLADALLAACDRYADGREADDDMTVLVVKARERPSRLSG